MVDLCEKATEIKHAKLEHEDTVEDNKLLEEKLQTDDGKLSDPKTLTAWTNTFSDIPELTFGYLYSYLVGNLEYSEENLRSFKSVTDLKCCPVENRKFFSFRFKVKPSEKAKTEDGQINHNGFLILKAIGEVHSTHATDLVIYTNKGILIVHVEFNARFWQRTLDKLQLFFAKFMVPELLTGKILTEIRA